MQRTLEWCSVEPLLDLMDTRSDEKSNTLFLVHWCLNKEVRKIGTTASTDPVYYENNTCNSGLFPNFSHAQHTINNNTCLIVVVSNGIYQHN